MLVLPRTSPHVPLPRTAPLRWSGGGQSRDLGDPGGIRVLLSDPRWEKRLVRFLELSDVGRAMADGMDEDEARRSGWTGGFVWEAAEGG